MLKMNIQTQTSPRAVEYAIHLLSREKCLLDQALRETENIPPLKRIWKERIKKSEQLENALQLLANSQETHFSNLEEEERANGIFSHLY
jgi:hypothetical protein